VRYGQTEFDLFNVSVTDVDLMLALAAETMGRAAASTRVLE